MKKNISTVIKNPKLLLWICCALILLILSYRLAITKTIEIIFQYHELAEGIDNLTVTPDQVQQLTGKIQDLERVIGYSDLSNEDIRQHILNELSELSEQYQISIIDIPKEIVYRLQDYEVSVNTFILGGSFHHLLNVLHALGNKPGNGKIVSAHFYLHKDFLSVEPKLLLALYLQNIKKFSI